MRQTSHIAIANRINRNGHDNGNGARCSLHDRNCRSHTNYNDIDMRPGQLFGQSGKKLKSAFSEAPFNDEIPVLRVTQLTHTAQKSTVYRTFHVSWARTAGKKPYAPNFTRLLRTRCERPSRRAADKRDEVAPPHEASLSRQFTLPHRRHWGCVVRNSKIRRRMSALGHK